jgi:NAD(P) transhydrogenase subunit alpha
MYMAQISAQEAADRARDAAEMARQAAEAAQSYADIAATSVHAVTAGAIDPFVFRLSIFVLAVFVGYYVVWSVTPALHTPLMSVTNAISGIIVVGGILEIGHYSTAVTIVSAFAVLLASINIFGGFAVTRRMLAMFVRS